MVELSDSQVFAVTADHPRAAARIRNWLLIVALLVAAMVLIGGATRLTDSGLSITEWRPVTGALLPLSDEAWFEEFMLYQGIPEYQFVNKGMSIDEFKTIYIWEWVHRNFGRLIGMVFLIPFVYFIVAGQVRGRLTWRLGIVFLLGGLQAFTGWYMVSSGLGPDSGVDVSQYRLAIHLGLAFIILGAIAWTILDLRPATGVRQTDDLASEVKARRAAALLLVLVFVQALAGALVAGLRAGLAYNTWPLMDGAIVPDGLLAVTPWYLNFFENALTVQFDHRIIAYVLLVAALVHVLRVKGEGPARRARWIAYLVVAQVGLGIATLLTSVPISLGLAHQAMAMVVFVLVLHHLHSAWRLGPPDGDQEAPSA